MLVPVLMLELVVMEVLAAALLRGLELVAAEDVGCDFVVQTALAVWTI